MNCKLWKLKSSIPYNEELTVFIKVKIEILNECSKEMPKKVRNEERNIIEHTKIITDKKYLLIINLSKLISEKKYLLFEILIGLTCEIKLFNENLNKV